MLLQICVLVAVLPSSLLILVLSCRFSDSFSSSDDVDGGDRDAAMPPPTLPLPPGTPEWLMDLEEEERRGYKFFSRAKRSF